MVNFLGLPPDVRRRIYCDAGLVTNGRVDVLSPYDSQIRVPPEDRHTVKDIFDEEGPLRYPAPDWGWHRRNVAFSLGLLLVCRAINAEASSLFYSTNQFLVCPIARRASAIGTSNRSDLWAGPLVVS